MRPVNIDDLIDRRDPGIALVRAWAGQPGANACDILAGDPDLARETLLHLGVSTRSILGAIVFETGGLSIAGGLIRLWGSGAERSLLQANRAAAVAAGQALADILLVGDDAFGGLFALNGGGFGREGLGEVFHLSADEGRWNPLDVGHSDFVAWCLTGDLGLLYGDDTCASRLSGHPVPSFGRSLSVYPPLWTREGQTASGTTREIDADAHLRLRIELFGFEVS